MSFVKGRVVFSVPFPILCLLKPIVLLVFLPEVIQLGGDVKKQVPRSFCFVILSAQLTRLQVNLEYFLLVDYLAFHTLKTHLTFLFACTVIWTFPTFFSIDLGVLLFGL